MSAYFSKEFSKFFIELAPNNNKDWFDANRDRYEEFVKKPFRAFTEKMIEGISKADPRVKVSASESIFRINRDIRFSKDKYPYKMHMAAAISHAGKKMPDVSGFYFQLSPEGIQIYQGAYFIETPTLHRLRDYIVSEKKIFKKLISAKKFTDTYGGIQGDGNSRLSGEIKKAAEELPMLAAKNFYWGAMLPAKTILAADLDKQLMDHYKAGKALGDFLDEGMK